jgi:hypothetical protein
LVVIALGTNDAAAGVHVDLFYTSFLKLVMDVLAFSPGSISDFCIIVSFCPVLDDIKLIF